MSDQSKPVMLTEEQLARLELMASENPGILEYAHNVGGVPIHPTEEGAIKAKSVQAMAEQTSSTMGILSDFMKLALQHADRVKKRVEVSKLVYNAEIKFEPNIGGRYYLYQRFNGKYLLSMVSPSEWGQLPFRKAVARIQLLADHTWEVVEDFEGVK